MIREVITCPSCEGTGHITFPDHEHEMRLAISMHGEKFNYMRWECECGRQLCTDCIADGLDYCGQKP